MIVDILVLALLEKGPRHGYEIKKKAREILVSELALNNNLLYPALRRLEAEGYIEPEAAGAAASPSSAAVSSAAVSSAGPSRKAFKITRQGRKRLTELISDFGEEEAAKDNEFLVRLAFFDLVGAAERKSIVEARLRAIERKKGRIEKLSEERLGPSSSTWMGEIIRRRLAELDADLAWTGSLLAARAPKEGA
jgi:DNA-binding PadR family transcriptional regulator